VREEIREIQQNLGLTVLYVTHDQEESLAVSDRIVLMRQAAIAQEGTPQNLYEEPADLYVADFIGDANLVEAEVTDIREGTATVRIGAIRRELPGRGLPVGKAHVAIRPEAIQLSPGRSPAGMEATVRKATYLGSHIHYAVDCPLGELFVVSPYTGTRLPAGAAVSLTLAAHGVTLVGD
jgi:iron(III) transport system ATP-binding protein